MGEQPAALKEASAGGSLPFETVRPVIQQEPPEIPAIDEGGFWDTMGEADMEFIPPTGYPEMDVTPVSEADQQAILHSLNSSTSGSFDGARYPDMEPIPVSEEDVKAMMQALKQSGRPMAGPLP